MARAPRIRKAVTGPVIHRHPPDYSKRWHRVYEWARDALLGDPMYYFPPPPSIRTAGWRGTWVYDPGDEEEAAERGIFMSELDRLPVGPDRNAGGTRRVSIRFHTWLIDDLGAHEPRWVTTGWGMSAAAAQRAHNRWIREYREDVANHVESRRLVATEMEIVWWTAEKGAAYA